MLESTALETILPILEKLSVTATPNWGSMSAQRMVEHLTDTLKIATGAFPVEAVITDSDRILKMQEWLFTDKEMGQNIEVAHAGKNIPLRHEELELAIDEFVDEMLAFDEFFESTPNKTTLHPYYGQLNYEQWKLMNKKHLTHHFKQFGLI